MNHHAGDLKDEGDDSEVRHGVDEARSLHLADPGDSERLAHYACALARAEELDNAVDAFLELKRMRRLDDSELRVLSDCLSGLSRSEEAVAEVEDELSEGRESAELRYALGMAYCNLGQFDRGLVEFRRCEQLQPGTARFAVGIGLALDGLGETESSLAAFIRAAALNPAWHVSWIQMGWFGLDHGYLTIARVALEKAYELAPDDERCVQLMWHLNDLAESGSDTATFLRESRSPPDLD